MANFRGLSERTGKRAKQMMKQARAARLQPPNTRRRSHLLTVDRTSQQGSRISGHALAYYVGNAVVV
jgi:hypothetical protein